MKVKGIDSGIQIHGRKRAMNILKPLIEEWIAVVRSYCEQCDGEDPDVPYWYGERANISLLAAAAWKAGMVAVEEYQTHKRPGAHKRGPNGHGFGRCDLFVLAPGKHEFQIEAKHKWMRTVRSDKSHKNTVDDVVEQACADATRDTETKKRIGCVFFVPYWPTTSTYKNDPASCIRQELLRYLRNDEVHLWAWCFPKIARLQKHRESRGDNRFYPGVIVGIKAAKYFSA